MQGDVLVTDSEYYSHFTLQFPWYANERQRILHIFTAGLSIWLTCGNTHCWVCQMLYPLWMCGFFVFKGWRQQPLMGRVTAPALSSIMRYYLHYHHILLLVVNFKFQPTSVSHLGFCDTCVSNNFIIFELQLEDKEHRKKLHTLID